MKYICIILIGLFVSSCASNKVKTVEGSWKQEFLSYKTENVSVPLSSDNAIMLVSKEDSKLKIEFDFKDGYEKDQTDSIQFKYPELKFKKINLGKTANYYQLNYNETCDCFLGEMKSYTGNVLNIKLLRVLEAK